LHESLDTDSLQPFGIAPLDKTNRLKPSDCFVGGAKAPLWLQRKATTGVILPFYTVYVNALSMYSSVITWYKL
jgi:hypothetical protein